MELLVVITIVAILAAMVVPVANIVLQRVREMQAKNLAIELRKSISTYATDYRRYPVRRSGPPAGDRELESNATLMNVLLAADSETGAGGLNPRQTVYFSGKKASAGARPRAGVEYGKGGGGALYDSWSNHFRVILDTDADERCPDPLERGETIAQAILVWSPGRNEADERGGGDDQPTW